MYILETIKNIKDKPKQERRKIMITVFFIFTFFMISVWSFGINRTTANNDVSLTDQSATVLPTSPFGVVGVNFARIFDAFKNFISR